LANAGGTRAPALTPAAVYGIIDRMEERQKITAIVPVELLRRAQSATGKGVTETVIEGLTLLAAAKAAEDLRRLRGKLKLHIDLAELRRDRR